MWQELKMQKLAKMQLLERHKDELQAMNIASPHEDVLSKSLDSAMETTKRGIIDSKRRTRRRGVAVDFDDSYGETFVSFPPHIFLVRSLAQS